MARVTGPLMSMEASGTIAGAITFAKWKGRPYARTHVIPANPRSAAQVATRAILSFLTRYWATNVPDGNGDWKDLGSQMSVSPFNAYVSYNAKRLSTLDGFAIDPSLTGPNTPATATSLTAVGGVGEISGVLTIGTADPDYIVEIFADTGAITPSRAQLRQIVADKGTPTMTYSITRVPPGTYHVNFRSLTYTGEVGSKAASDATCTVT